MIVLFTDFGLTGPYTGQVKAVLARLAPGIPVIDLFADAPTCDPRRSAYLLAAYAGELPLGTTFVCVVDPGVGGARKPVILRAEGRTFVGPDNGLMEIVARRAGAEAVWSEILWRPESLSCSFHGRDLFAPVAASLALGKSVNTRDQMPTPCDSWPDDLAEVIYVDVYGNAMTGLRGEALAGGARLLVSGRILDGAYTFSDLPPGGAFWYVNSNGLVEIAVNQGRADRELGIAVGSQIEISG
ncbi:S-adenosyl-l-methionine hydroxide adenosyltransferase family protein [Magnetospira sp. QH-2]|uniref:SAM hydrolase/SAM-dependent halogenase family protein n=1 Tax=Magnetospira sp. (strain QH-2) TaxID=1288970 RepID=UPI0003E80EE9|nr:SAM-dependent chlorinase/fluorinase [Magnetospira sp. QH-2]CCQ73423.1 Conserved protein of unknown function. Protein containing DUF62 [Magnetospira sp. QH-2]